MLTIKPFDIVPHEGCSELAGDYSQGIDLLVDEAAWLRYVNYHFWVVLLVSHAVAYDWCHIPGKIKKLY